MLKYLKMDIDSYIFNCHNKFKIEGIYYDGIKKLNKHSQAFMYACILESQISIIKNIVTLINKFDINLNNVGKFMV